MAKKVVITLTEHEAAELVCVAGNGYGDGDFYQMNSAEGRGGDKRGNNTYWRIINKIQAARAIARKRGARP